MSRRAPHNGALRIEAARIPRTASRLREDRAFQLRRHGRAKPGTRALQQVADRRQPVDVGGAVAARRHDTLSVRGERRAPRSVRVIPEELFERPRRRVPDADGAVLARGDEQPAVGTEVRARDGARHPEDAQLTTRGCVEDPSGTVGARRRDLPAVGAEGGRVEDWWRVLQETCQAERVGAPDLDALAPGREDLAAVWTEDGRRDQLRWYDPPMPLPTDARSSVETRGENRPVCANVDIACGKVGCRLGAVGAV